MQKLSLFLLLFWLIFLAACSSPKTADRSTIDSSVSSRTSTTDKIAEGGLAAPTTDMATSTSARSSEAKGSSAEEAEHDKTYTVTVDDGKNNERAGAMTAGEWSDLREWKYWQKLLKREEFAEYAKNWNANTLHRISVLLKGGDGKPAMDIKLELLKGGKVVFTARTDNKGSAELFAAIGDVKSEQISLSDYQLRIADGAQTVSNLKRFDDGVNEIKVPLASEFNIVEIAFIVDATGSMGDELRYLQTELRDVIARASAENKSLQFRTASVFYRDEGDAYVTRHSDFSADIETTQKFISSQRADGGGDFPEAVEDALEVATSSLAWSEAARTRIAFLILDAPPHEDAKTQERFHAATLAAAAKGIKIIPITASGIDKSTEFLMRYLAITTNGTYTFVTDHSGIGESHLEPSIGKYKVEFLNNLMVRLIKQYTS